MVFRLAVAAFAILIVGCSQKQDQAVYDTDRNPDNFPPQAVEILRNIENGTLTGGEAITEAFGDLFTQHSELLDREEWKAVVERLGVWFEKTADSLVGQGMASFGVAAEYYQLGSFARPDDTALGHDAALFACWPAARDALPEKVQALQNGRYGLDEVLSITRYFMLADTVREQFFETYLSGEIRKTMAESDLLGTNPSSQLGSADRALLAYAGLTEESELAKLTTFAPPAIDLIGARVARLDSTEYRLELYFLPREVVRRELKIYLHLESTDRGATPLEIIPREPTTTWAPGRIVALSRTIHYPARLEKVAVGLADFATSPPGFIPPEGSSSDLFFLELPEPVRD